MNKKKLYQAIKKQGLTKTEFCEKIGMSRSAFYKKCNGLSEFTLSEIKLIMTILGLKSPNEIFFAHSVS